MLGTMFRDTTFDRLSRQMDHLFNTVARDAAQPPVTRRFVHAWPTINLWQDGGSLFAEAELPGFAMDEIEVYTTDDTLTIRGERSTQRPEGAEPIRIERPQGRFERTISLPSEIKADEVEATLRNGVLLITMPKTEARRARRIEVKGFGSGEETRSLPKNG